MNKKINAMYFSATGTTQKIVNGIAKRFSEKVDQAMDIKSIDFTLPEARKESVSFSGEDVVILGIPVYAGRVPNI